MHYAIDGKYPIETKEQLTKTSSYFDKYLIRFHPKERVKIAATMEKRASELGVYLDCPWVKNYSRAFSDSPSVSPDFDKNIEMRKHACRDMQVTGKLKADNILEKLAQIKNSESPNKIVDLLFDFDKLANLEYQWDKSIVDPVMTVFGSLNNPEYDAVKIAGDITNYTLKKLASNESEIVKIAGVMGKQFQSAFSKDPVNTVSGLLPMEKEAFCKAVKG